MKPHPRPPIIRKTIKWGGAAVTALLVMVWIGSAWWTIRCELPFGMAAGVYPGQVTVGKLGPYDSPIMQWSFKIDRNPGFQFFWWFDLLRVPEGWELCVPAWGPLGAILLATTLAWRADTLARRRARLNLCPKCNYDRTGLALNAPCPECGNAPNA